MHTFIATQCEMPDSSDCSLSVGLHILLKLVPQAEKQGKQDTADKTSTHNLKSRNTRVCGKAALSRLGRVTLCVACRVPGQGVGGTHAMRR